MSRAVCDETGNIALLYWSKFAIALELVIFDAPLLLNSSFVCVIIFLIGNSQGLCSVVVSSLRIEILLFFEFFLLLVHKLELCYNVLD